MREFPIRSESAYLYERAWRKDIFVQYLLQLDSSRKVCIKEDDNNRDHRPSAHVTATFHISKGRIH
jgi:hypothetical protein